MYWLHAINTMNNQPTGCMYVFGTEQSIRDNCQRLGYEITTLLKCMPES